MRSLALVLGLGMCVVAPAAEPALTVSWKDNILTIHGKHLPGGKVVVWYLEAYCRIPPSSHHLNQSTRLHA
jgi:hypothetical protein